MVTSWIQTVMSLVAWLCGHVFGIFGHGFVYDLRSFEPRAWLILATIFLAGGALMSFVRSTSHRMAATRRRTRRPLDSAWNHRLDGE
mgnify:CR=1 FL=1